MFMILRKLEAKELALYLAFRYDSPIPISVCVKK